MFYLRLFMTSLRSLDAHFLRSLLATLGVLIGVASVVACMSLLEGWNNDVTKRFQSLGSNVLYVFPQDARVGGQRVGFEQTLTLRDIDVLVRELATQVDRIAPEALGGATVKRFQNSGEFTVVGTSEAYFEINAFKAGRGRVFSEAESRDDTCAVVVLGAKLAEKMFGGNDPIGQALKVGGGSYRVVGVLEKKGSVGFLNADETVFMPINGALKRFFARKWLNRLTISAKNSGELDVLKKQVARVLRSSHNIRPGQRDDFEIFNQEQALENVNGFFFVFKVVFYSIAGISLVVGGIGIMNIMLVSVTERTREIGVRIACGARRLDILLQFVVEALVISCIGGALGLLLGAMLADVMENVLKSMDFKTEVNAKIVIAALMMSTFTGVFSGFYPAFKASRLDPVDALRYE